MGELTTSRTAELIAAEINDIKDRTKRVVIYNSIEIGRRLTEAKELVAPGEWGKWLEESVDYKKSTANNLMRIFREYGADQLSLLGSNTAKEIYDKLDYSKAVIMLGTTEEEKEKLIEENDIESISSRELKRLTEELKAARREIVKSDERLKEANKALEDAYDRKEKDLDKANKIIEKLKKDGEKRKEEVDKAKEEVVEFKTKLKDVESELEEIKSNPIEVTGNLEANKELEKEIDKLNKEKKELEEKLKAKEEVVEVDDATQRYAIYFKEINDKFDELLGALEQMKSEEDKEDYTEATRELLNMMEEKIK